MPTVRELLHLEQTYPAHTPAKYDAIRELGLTESRFYQLLHRAAGSIEGQACDPVTSHRVLRMIQRSA